MHSDTNFSNEEGKFLRNCGAASVGEYNKIRSTYWMRLSMISWIINAEVWVICQSRKLSQITQTLGLIIHDIMRKPNSLIILLYIFQTICQRRHLSERTLHLWGAWKLGRLWTRHNYLISATNIGLSCQLTTLLNNDYMLTNNQSFDGKSTV